MTAKLSLNRSDLGHTGPSLTRRVNDEIRKRTSSDLAARVPKTALLAVGHERPSFDVPGRLVARASAEPNATFRGS